jgi:hypothetical protein
MLLTASSELRIGCTETPRLSVREMNQVLNVQIVS